MNLESFDSLQALLDAFIKLSHKLTAGLTDGTIKSIDYSQTHDDDVLELALTEIRKAMQQAGIDTPLKDGDLSLRGHMQWALENYQLSMPLAALARRKPNHPLLQLTNEDEHYFRTWVQGFCDAVATPEVDLNDANDRRVMAPLFTMGCAFLGIGQAFGLQGTEEMHVMQHMLAAMHQAGVLEP